MATAKELMSKAQELIEQAKKVEANNAFKIGRYVMSKIDTVTLGEIKQFVIATVDGVDVAVKKDGKKFQTVKTVGATDKEAANEQGN